MRLLVLATYPNTAAATRFRTTAYFPHLRAAGIEPELLPFLDERLHQRLYEPSPAAKAAGLAAATLKRLATAVCGTRYNGVLVQREAALVGPPWLEAWLVRGLRLPMIYDLDDAVWLSTHDASQHPWAARLLKHPGKVNWLIRQAAHVTAGSQYLARHAAGLGAKVTVLPTVVESTTWHPLPGRLDGDLLSDPPIIGWIGTHSTARQLELVWPALRELKRRGHRFRVRLVGAPTTPVPEELDVESVPWTLEREVEDFQRLDIGLGPMHHDAWSRGKCGFKQFQYLAVGVPTVSTAEGGAAELLVHDENALIAETEEDWTHQIERLLTSRDLRASLARNGRQLVEQQLCIEAQAPVLASVVRTALEGS